VIASLNRNKLFMVGLLCIGSTALVWHLCYTAQIVSSQYIINDDTFSIALNKSITGLIEQKNNLAADDLFNDLKTDFPMVDQIVVRRIGLNKNLIKVAAADLVWRLGSAFVLSKKGQVFLANGFKASMLRMLPKINLHTTAESANDIENEQKQFLLNLPDFIMAEYSIHWHGPNKIILIKNNRQIVLRHDQKLTQEILATCNKLFSDYQRHANKTCKGTIKADIRFGGQVVISC
jgi:hypothetical protein